jgi:hypothetical protein
MIKKPLKGFRTFALPMSNRLTGGTTRGEEEQMYVRVGLGYHWIRDCQVHGCISVRLEYLVIINLPLKYKLRASVGISTLRDPSLNRLPQFHGTRLPSFIFCIRTTGLRIPGTAAEASKALQITVSGAVI